MTSQIETLEIVNLLKRLPNSPVVDKESLSDTVNLFLLVLQDMPIETVRAATVQYLSEGNPFFPSNPGVLRDKAMELQMLAIGIPSGAEAWGMVLTAVKPVMPKFCEEGATLRDVALTASEDYFRAVRAYSIHLDTCTVCDAGGFREQYTHPAVAETVRLLGGRDVILTDNPMADRARFIDAYKEVISRERMKMGMTPQVAQFIENNRPLLVGDEIKQLSARLQK